MNDPLIESAKEIEALRETVAEWERGDRQYPQAVQDYKDLCVELKRTQFDLAAMTQERDAWNRRWNDAIACDEANCEQWADARRSLAAMTQERDAYRSVAEGEPLDAYQAVCDQLASAQAEIERLKNELKK